MLKGIQSYILASLAMPCRPRAPRLSSAERRKLVRLVNNMQSRRIIHDRSGLLKRAQSFYPACEYNRASTPPVSITATL